MMGLAEPWRERSVFLGAGWLVATRRFIDGDEMSESLESLESRAAALGEQWCGWDGTLHALLMLLVRDAYQAGRNDVLDEQLAECVFDRDVLTDRARRQGKNDGESNGCS